MSVINSGIIVVVVVGGCSKEDERKKREKGKNPPAPINRERTPQNTPPSSDFYLHAMMRTNCNNLRDRAAVVLRNVYIVK